MDQNVLDLLDFFLSDSDQMIRIFSAQDKRLLYMNRRSRENAVHGKEPYEGRICHEYLMGKDHPCSFCPFLKLKDNDEYRTEIPNLDRTLAVRVRKAFLQDREIMIEYAWDITTEKRASDIYDNQIHNLLSSIPNSTSIYHLDLTLDIVTRISESSAFDIPSNDNDTIDTFVQRTMQYISDPEISDQLIHIFNRQSLIHAYRTGKVQFDQQVRFINNSEKKYLQICVRLLTNPLNDHLEAIMYTLDVTHEKMMEETLQEQLQVVAALSRDFLNIYLMNPNTRTGRVIKLDGYNPEGIHRQQPFDYDEVSRLYIRSRVHPDDREMVRHALGIETIVNQLEHRSEYTGNYRVLDHGETHYFQYKYLRVDGYDQIIYGFMNIDDLMYSQIQEQKKLEAALYEAEKASRAKSAFLFNMSHDIRTPMNAVIGFTKLMENHLDDPDRCREYLSHISEASHTLLSIINNVLEMARIENGSLALHETALDLNAFTSSQLNMFEPMIREKNITLRKDISLIHSNVICDETKLGEIINNIFSNACKYSKQNGIITFTLKETDIKDDTSTYVIQIKDTGIGISQQFMPHLFDEFAREKDVRESQIDGTGLGMPIVKRLMDAMKGTIDVKSEKGKGTDVTCIFTFHHGNHNTVRKTTDTDHNFFSGKHILLAEDNTLNAQIAMEILENAGLGITWAHNGEECVTQLKEHRPDTFDLILMDIQMPVKNGYEAAREIRQMNDERNRIPILAMTANAFEEDRKAALAAGMNDHIAKPVDTEILMTTLKKHLHQDNN